MLLFGGVIATWSAYDAITDEPAYAADEPHPGIVGNLLGGAEAAAEGVLSLPPATRGGSATLDRRPTGLDVVREPASVTAGTAGARVLACAERDPAVQVQRGDLPAVVAPVRRGAERAAGADGSTAVEADPPVTRPVAGATAPLVQGIAGTELLDSVDSVVGPVAQPIVETLAPVLAPLTGVTRPILGQPASALDPPCDPVEPQPEHCLRMHAVAPTHPIAVPPGRCWKVAVERCRGGESATGAAADASRGAGRIGGTGTGGLTPTSPGSATSSASSGAGTAAAVEVSGHPWTPDLVSEPCASSACETFRRRSPQPDTRPA
ncbi:hypothetical protein C1I99_05645 [Micromonospora deserti]|uniref:Uncharacterized protein n=2 Tax=Micromonospora deserti TaxID=2070366 RepID=A0A2W2CT22_9ACTN|nr:hypothetical protein C1I99_05645 [Micromonospora deserti]